MPVAEGSTGSFTRPVRRLRRKKNLMAAAQRRQGRGYTEADIKKKKELIKQGKAKSRGFTNADLENKRERMDRDKKRASRSLRRTVPRPSEGGDASYTMPVIKKPRPGPGFPAKFPRPNEGGSFTMPVMPGSRKLPIDKMRMSGKYDANKKQSVANAAARFSQMKKTQ